MKYYISFLLFGLLALTFVSCNTDDLQKDVDALKDRVASYEAQVQQLNDEMNIVRVLLDGNKTITDYSKDGDTYTLTLSNGETLTLTPGVVGGNYPSIEIGESGNWVIAGKDTGLRAKAQDGEDSTITPQFKVQVNPVDGGKKYWYVSYDEGATWAALENGVAEGVNSSTSPINKAEVVGSTLEVTLSDGTKHRLPIVRGLVCAINKPEGLVDNVWAVASGSESSFTVKVNLADGDLVRVKAPVEWKTKLTGNTAGSTEVTVTVTAPSIPSQCVIAVEVTHGVSTVADHLKVRTASDSYYDDYNNGFDIRIGDLVINKYDYPGAQMVQDGGTISANGFYFIADGATVDWTGGTSSLIVLPEKKSGVMPSLGVATSNGFLSLTGGAGTLGVVFKDIRLFWKNYSNGYFFNIAKDNIVRRVVFQHCIIEMPKDKSFSYMGLDNIGIDDIVVESCQISFPAPTEYYDALKKVVNVYNFWSLSKGSYQKAIIRNNIFYCSDANQSCPIVVMSGQSPTYLTFENNTFINISSNHGGTSGYVKALFQNQWTFKNNLIWYNAEWVDIATSSGSPLSSLVGAPVAWFNMDAISGNQIFTGVTDTKLVWSYFRVSPLPEGVSNPRITPSTENPFESLTATEGKYVLKPAYKGIGATID